MAVVKAPGLSIQASGNIGPINYTRWRGLNVARTTYTYTDPNTTLQITQRAHLTLVSQKWGGALKAAERGMWEELARDERFKDRMGGEYVPTGYQVFMKLNLQRVVFGNPIMFEPPSKPIGVFVFDVRINAHPVGNRNLITMEGALMQVTVADGFEIFRAGPYDSGGRRAIAPEYRFLALERTNYYYLDYDVIDTKYYWYKVRWFFEEGWVGNWWEGQVLTDFPGV